MIRPVSKAWRGAARLLRDRRGATAVEFAIVAAPFFLMIFAILQLALVFMVDVTLDNATAIEGRKFMTGQECIDTSMDTSSTNTAQQQDKSNKQTRLKNSICSNMSWLQSQCVANLSVDIRSYTSFSGASTPPPISTNSSGAYIDNNKIQDTSGGPSTINVLTAYYQWKLPTPYLYGGLQTLPGGIHLVTSTEVLDFEPSSGTTPTCISGAPITPSNP